MTTLAHEPAKTPAVLEPPPLPLAARTAEFRIPSLDGLRAVAVAMVFMAHGGLDSFVPGGFGVSMFFFLSGFLITSLIRREYERTGRINFRNFYMRRILRIWPPLYIVLVATVIAVLTGVVPGRVEPLPLIFQAGHLANVYYLAAEGHFMPGTGVLWSLAVEEHFYLIFPAACLWLLRNRSSRQFAAALLILCLIVLAWRCVLRVGVGVPDYRTYKATDTRIDSILFGCILAVYYNPYMDVPRHLSMKSKVFVLAAACAVLLLTFLNRNAAFRETFRYTLQGLALFPIFYLAVLHSDWPIFRWLNWGPVRAVGIVSYTVYLVHYVVLYAVWNQLGNRQTFLVLIVAAAAIAALAAMMYYAVERPCGLIRKRLHA